MSLNTWSARLIKADCPSYASIHDPDGQIMGVLWDWQGYRRKFGVPQRGPDSFVAICMVYDRDQDPCKLTSLEGIYQLDRDGTPFGTLVIEPWKSPMPRQAGNHGQYAFWLDLAMEAGLELPGMEDHASIARFAGSIDDREQITP